jgi:hypothetical protein
MSEVLKYSCSGVELYFFCTKIFFNNFIMGKIKLFSSLFIIALIVSGSYVNFNQNDDYVFEKDEAFMKEAMEYERKQKEMFDKYVKPKQQEKFVKY